MWLIQPSTKTWQGYKAKNTSCYAYDSTPPAPARNTLPPGSTGNCHTILPLCSCRPVNARKAPWKPRAVWRDGQVLIRSGLYMAHWLGHFRFGDQRPGLYNSSCAIYNP